MLASFQLYLFKSYVGLSTKDAAAAMTVLSMCILVPSIFALLVAAPLSDRLRRRKPMVVLCAVALAIGIIVPFLWPAKMAMFIYAGFAGLCFGIYNTVDQALNVDVLLILAIYIGQLFSDSGRNTIIAGVIWLLIATAYYFAIGKKSYAKSAALQENALQ